MANKNGTAGAGQTLNGRQDGIGSDDLISVTSDGSTQLDVPVGMGVIAHRIGTDGNWRDGIIVPAEWATEPYGPGVNWVITSQVRGAVTVDYYKHGDTNLSMDEPFGGVSYVKDSLHDQVRQTNEGAVVFAQIGRTKRTGRQYSACIIRESVSDADYDDENETDDAQRAANEVLAVRRQGQDDSGTDSDTRFVGRQYRATVLLAMPNGPSGDEVAVISAGAIAVGNQDDRRVAYVRNLFGTSPIIRDEKGKVIYWQRDPYDANFADGEPMYAYERWQYDGQFPDTPLAAIRRLVAGIVKNN